MCKSETQAESDVVINHPYVMFCAGFVMHVMFVVWSQYTVAYPSVPHCCCIMHGTWEYLVHISRILCIYNLVYIYNLIPFVIMYSLHCTHSNCVHQLPGCAQIPGVGFCWAMNWLSNFGVTLSFPVLVKADGSPIKNGCVDFLLMGFTSTFPFCLGGYVEDMTACSSCF